MPIGIPWFCQGRFDVMADGTADCGDWRGSGSKEAEAVWLP